MLRLLTYSQDAVRRAFLPVAAIALVAALVNTLAIPVGGGPRLLVGNVIAFAALRFLPRRGGLVLAPLAASPLWWMWGDPVMWLVWTGHIALIACVRASSPIIVTVLYCLTGSVAISLAGDILVLHKAHEVA